MEYVLELDVICSPTKGSSVIAGLRSSKFAGKPLQKKIAKGWLLK
jgi:hypothetical protein